MPEDSFLPGLSGLVEGQGAVVYCGCGLPITEYEGAWLHVLNDDLMGTGDHDPTPR